MVMRVNHKKEQSKTVLVSFSLSLLFYIWLSDNMSELHLESLYGTTV